MRKYNVLLFDLDGTILDTSLGIMHSVEDTIIEFNLPEISVDIKRTMIGPPIDKSFKEIFKMTDVEAMVAADVFRKNYAEKYLMEAVPYPNIMKLLKTFREDGWKIGVATYKRNDYAQQLLFEKGITQLCDFVLGSDGIKQSKADIINICLENLGEGREKCIMVGDTYYDLIGAKETGVAFVGVTFGFGFKTHEEVIANGAIASAASVDELKTILNHLAFNGEV